MRSDQRPSTQIWIGMGQVSSHEHRRKGSIYIETPVIMIGWVRSLLVHHDNHCSLCIVSDHAIDMQNVIRCNKRELQNLFVREVDEG